VQNQLENILQAMRDALEKLERAIQLPSRKEFESMTSRVADLSKRLDEVETNGPKKKAAKKSAAPAKKPKK
jgi:hypothetical protein